MPTYNPVHKPNQIVCGKGRIAIATGWTDRHQIAKHLSSDEYAAIGQLYSPTRGINLLVRNLLANPHVRCLVILNATEADRRNQGWLCLGDFFRYGVIEGSAGFLERPCWIVDSDVAGYIDREIPYESLETLRANIRVEIPNSDLVVGKSGIQKTVDFVKDLAARYKRSPPTPWGQPKAFPMPEKKSRIFPGSRYGHRIEGKTVAETWVKIIHRIRTTGTLRPTGYDGQWQELIDMVAIVTNEPPEDFYFPEPNYLPVDREFMRGYIGEILNDAPYQEGVKYTYGQRLRSWFRRDQVEQVIEKLANEIDAASAVMSLWDVRDHEKGGSPCLNHIWVRVVGNELSLTATLRSNDMFAAWPANAMGLRALQKHICDRVNQEKDLYDLQLGPLITISQSAHIYDDCWEHADDLIHRQYNKQLRDRDFYDPSGNFEIELEDGKIAVRRLVPDTGEAIATYRDDRSLRLLRNICAEAPALHTEHAGYLGIELQKAEDALKNGRSYEQDK